MRLLKKLPILLPLFCLGLFPAFGLLPASAREAPCPEAAGLHVPGSERQVFSCLEDLTTPGLLRTGHTVISDWTGLHSIQTPPPERPVPGVQIDGYFPDTSSFNTHHGWNHDAQFVLRLPHDWNGKLIVTGAPGNRRQYALDFTISDWAVSRGYAFASTDKGNSGTSFYRDGKHPGDAVREWHRRVTELTRAAKETLRLRYGREADRIYITGISNGGYLTRYALENHPDLYDGGVDWEGTLFRAEGPNLFTYLPVALREYPSYRSGDRGAYGRMIDAGFPPGSEFLWDFHYTYYWDLTQRIYREEFDPGYDGEREAGIPFCQSGTPGCDTDYDYASRPPSVKEAIRKVSLDGTIGKPLITLHGTLDTLLPARTDSDVYHRLIRQNGRAELHRYYMVEGGTHVDALYDLYPDRLRPILPCYREAFEHLEKWVEEGRKPPSNREIPRKDPDPVNHCSM
ncbi:tannase/feruloyl esterase [Melghirimyces profundicolus]|uniref:Tannase/feruloyl esterase n=1 Tax=Melghirimyces profundicolus TaxID=1242148 RepID=A0A2T6BC77_9BACL|nr:tannase/feruloyl esterase family alpha/beta hydrolase [Melghirimyces profundicolus]PTX53680.1 tannase/feruloyl esterase [Melghirimyces profundicolus]